MSEERPGQPPGEDGAVEGPDTFRESGSQGSATPGEPRAQEPPPPLLAHYDVTQPERLYALLAYVLNFVTPVLPPLIVYVLKRESSQYVAFHALQALFLSLSVLVVAVLARSIAFLPHVLVVAASLAGLVGTIVGAVKAYDGEWYRLPVLGEWAARQAHLPDAAA